MFSVTPLPLSSNTRRGSVGGCSICEQIAEERGASAGAAADLAAKCKRPFREYVWTEEDYEALREAARAINARPEDLLLVLAYESEINPHAANCWPDGTYPGAAGLNQITRPNADAMKISEAERLSLLDMTVAEQMPYVARSFIAARRGKPFASPPGAVTLYQTNIAPATVPNEVIFTSPSTNYKANRGLDVTNDGVITRDDVRQVLQRVALSKGYRRALAELHGEAPVLGGPGQSGGGGGLGSVLLGIAAIAGAGYYGYRQGWFGDGDFR